MLVTPTTSNTARIGPPAMMPVPSDAGCMNTLVAPCRPCTAWCKEPFFKRTLTIRRRASSIAFWTATGTSLAFPLPIPTRPSPSPTTVNAAKARIRPPFTTLVTRLMLIIFSRRPSPRSSCCCRFCCCLPIGFAMFDLVRYVALELQAALAGSVGQRLHATVILEPRTIEGDRLDARGFGLLGDTLADDGGRRPVAAVLDRLAHVGFQRRRACQHPVARRRNDLRVNVAIRPRDHQPIRALEGDAHPSPATAAHASDLLVHVVLRFPFDYFFFVSLMVTCSSE